MLRYALLALLVGVASAQAPAPAPAAGPPSALGPAAKKQWTNAQVIIDINNVAQQAVRTLGIQNQLSSKVYALVHLAALKAIDPSAPAATQQAQAAYAAVAALDLLFPWRFNTNEQPLIKNYTKGVSGDEAAAIQEAATEVAVSLVQEAAADGFANFPSWYTPYNESTAQPGQYVFVQNQTYALYPQLARTTPFILDNTTRFDTPATSNPYTLSSPQYTPVLEEVTKLGSKASTDRTLEQTQSADFWADGNTTSTVLGHFYAIAQIVFPADIPLYDAATAFAQIGVAAFDASVAGWNQKYTVLGWRPITAIRSNWSAENYPELHNENWTPYLSTPPHPEYPSGHSATVGAAAAVIKSVLGTDTVTFAVGSEHPANFAPRTYQSITAAVEDVNDSRVWGGVHFRPAVTDGAALGSKVGDWTIQNWELLVGGAAAAPSGAVATQSAGRRL